ncbi:MAG: urate hydroxylase PuuD [Thiohalomonadales bacterium]
MEYVQFFERVAHFLFGITWIGLLYYFNFVQVPAMAAGLADKEGPGPAAIGKYVAPRALLWFRWSAVGTWIMGAGLLGPNLVPAFTLQAGFINIGMGAWLGTIMLLNVWGLIWPNQKKILGMKPATADEIAKAKRTALLASRTNTLLSIPMLYFMASQSHGVF